MSDDEIAPETVAVVCRRTRPDEQGVIPGFISQCEECQADIRVADSTLDAIAKLKRASRFLCVQCATASMQALPPDEAIQIIPPSRDQIAEILKVLTKHDGARDD